MKKTIHFFSLSLFLLLSYNLIYSQSQTLSDGTQPYSIENYTLLFEDDFSGGIKPEWEVDGDYWEFSNDKVSSNITTSYQKEFMLVGDLSWTNYSFSVDIEGISGTDKEIAFRVQDNQNLYMLHLIGPIQYSDIELLKLENGQFTTLFRNQNYPVENNRTYNVTVSVVDDSIKVFINDKLEIDIVDPTYLSGGIGLLGGWNGYSPCFVNFDNVKVVGETSCKLVAYYPFNGNANDESGNGHDLTNFGAELTADRFGQENMAYYFNGSDSYLKKDGGFDFTTDFTYSAWIKSDLAPDDPTAMIISMGTNGDNVRLISYKDHTKPGFDAWLGGGTGIYRSGTNINPNQWNHIVGIRENNLWKLYINGEYDSEIVGNDQTLNDQNLSVGKHPGIYLQDYFKGSIDDIKLYNCAISEEQISELYHEGGWGTNQPPIADAGEDQTLECAGLEGTVVTLDGSGSSDPDGDELTYTWYLGEEIVAGPSVESTTDLTLELGSYNFTLVVDDGTETASDDVVINIIDTTPPVVTVNEPITLWPANHKYVTVDVSEMISSIEDGCSGELLLSDVVITRVTSDEPEDDNGNGDGKTTEDIVIAEGCNSVDLRAERAGGENGRVYTVTVAVSDISGNVGTSEFEVQVPHDKNDIAIKDDTQYLVEGTCEVPLPSEALAKNSESDDESVKTEIIIPTEYQLSQNYPNPFNPTTNIEFSIPEANYVSLRVYDLLGKEIAVLVDESKSAGSYNYEFDASKLSSGIYVYRLQAGKFVDTKKLVLMK